MTILLVVGFLILIIVLGLCIGQISEDNDTPLGVSIFLIVLTLIGFGCVAGAFTNTPTAMDVYQGKTELRITYEGKTPVDSTVIYKKGR